MKNFSDLQACDLKVQIHLEVRPVSGNGFPSCRVMVNHAILFEGQLKHTKKFRLDIPLLDFVCVEIEMWGKEYDQHRETAVIIDQLTIDDFDIIPCWTGWATYAHERPDIGPTNYLGYNGVWKLQTLEPFYQWKHRITGQGWLLQPISTVRD